MPFQKGNKLSQGRPKGAKNKKSVFDAAMTEKALKGLREAVDNGEQWAIQEVIKRVYPTLKPITPDGSLDAEFLQLRMKELGEFEQRISALENGKVKNMSDEEFAAKLKELGIELDE